MASRESQIAAVREDLRRDDPALADRREPSLSLEETSELHGRQRTNAMRPQVEGRTLGAFRIFAAEPTPAAQDQQQRSDSHRAQEDELPRLIPRESQNAFPGHLVVRTPAPGASILAFEASRSSGRGQAAASTAAATEQAPEEERADGGAWGAKARRYRQACRPKEPVKGNKGAAVKALCLAAECV